MNGQAPQDIVASVLAAADTESTVVAVLDANVVNYRWAVSTPTTNGDSRAQSVTITAISRTRGGGELTTGTRSGPVTAWPALLAAAEADAVGASAGAAESSELPAAVVRAEFDDAPAQPGAVALPGELAEAFGEADVEYFGYAEQSVETTYVGTSNGSRWRSVATAGRLEVSAKSLDRTRSAWFGTAGDDLAEVTLADGLGEVRAGLAAQRDHRDIPAEPTTVILSPSAVADLMLSFWLAAVARDAAEGHSPFTGDAAGGTALGRRFTDRRLTLESDPHLAGITCPDMLWTPWSSASATVFDTGSELGRVQWLTEGRLTALAATRAAHRDLGLPFVASPSNLRLIDADGHGSLAEVVTRCERAVLITSLWYIRDVDPQAMLVTGLTRDGTYLVEDGRITAGVGNFRFNDSPMALLSRIVDAGQAVRCLPREWGDYFTRTVMPPLVVEGFGLSTASQAV